uniref:TF-B3 domain-containing protein n=2 Tax=Triticum urartu TaxID=4572 RepID=A0A8R7QUH1_TRIUA
MAGASGQEVCGVCFNHCNYESKGSGFSMFAWEESNNAGVVPCNERARFNNVTGERVMFVANQRTYTVKCYKGRTKSAMYGRGWRKLYDDNKLGKGQMVVFFLDEPSPRAAICVIQVGNGSEDEQPMEEGDPIEDSYSDDEDGEASSDGGEGIVRTMVLLLNETEGFQLQGPLPLSDDFIGFPFFHRLTRTDIRLGMMIERGIETKTESSLKEGLGQQLKTDHMKESKDLTRDCLNNVPHTGTVFEVEGGKPGSDRNEEGRDKCVEDTDLEERGYDVKITDTEASKGLLYEEVLTSLSKSAQRKERREALLKRKKKRARIDPTTTKATIDEIATKAYSRCSMPYFSEIVNLMCKS